MKLQLLPCKLRYFPLFEGNTWTHVNNECFVTLLGDQYAYQTYVYILEICFFFAQQVFIPGFVQHADSHCLEMNILDTWSGKQLTAYLKSLYKNTVLY